MFVGALIIFILHDFVQIGGWYGFWIVANVDGNSGNRGADLAIPLDSVNEISKRFANALNGYFIGKRLAFSIVENYVKNTWAKYGIKRVMLHNSFFFFQFSSRKGAWILHVKKGKQLSKPKHIEEVRLTKPKPSFIYYPISRPANGNDEASTFQLNTNKVASDLLPDRIGKKEQELNLFSLKNSFDSLSKEDNVFEFNNDKGTVTDELASSILKSDSEEVEEVFVEKDLSIKPMDEVVDDARKKEEAPPKKTPKKTVFGRVERELP
ncbi:hypothetical protein Tco_0054421 [Tanacetum coccineum]